MHIIERLIMRFDYKHGNEHIRATPLRSSSCCRVEQNVELTPIGMDPGLITNR